MPRVHLGEELPKLEFRRHEVLESKASSNASEGRRKKFEFATVLHTAPQTPRLKEWFGSSRLCDTIAPSAFLFYFSFLFTLTFPRSQNDNLQSHYPLILECRRKSVFLPLRCNQLIPWIPWFLSLRDLFFFLTLFGRWGAVIWLYSELKGANLLLHPFVGFSSFCISYTSPIDLPINLYRRNLQGRAG